jgi:hypothetical protein
LYIDASFSMSGPALLGSVGAAAEKRPNPGKAEPGRDEAPML